MKILLASTLLLLAPVAARAACSASDFAIQDFKMSTSGSGTGLHLSLKGKIVNHCATAAAGQVKIEAKDASGNVLVTKQGWPAGTSNIAPGDGVDFDLGRLFRYQPEMQSYTVGIAEVRTW
ncbi:MAG: hypothetical protein ABW154_04250 [Dyella sp.]